MAQIKKNLSELRKPAGMTPEAWMTYLRTAKAADHVTNGYLVTTSVKCCDEDCGDHDPDAIALRGLTAKAVARQVLTPADLAEKAACELRLKARGLI